MFTCSDFNIVRLQEVDAAGLSQLMINNNEAFKPWFPLTLAANLSKEDSEVFIEKLSEDWENKKHFLWAMKISETIIGLIYIKELDWDKKQGEFAYCIDAAHSGKGRMREAVRVLSEYAFEKLGLEILQIIAHESNTGSRKVAMSCDFQFVKIMKNEYTPPGGNPLDMELFELRK